MDSDEDVLSRRGYRISRLVALLKNKSVYYLGALRLHFPLQNG